MAKKQFAQLAKMGVAAAVYVALCYVFAFASYGPIQFRVAEILVLLPYYDKKYCVPLILGTFTANIFMYGLPDMIFGTLATAMVCLVAVAVKNKMAIALAAALVNGVTIGLMLHFLLDEPNPFWFLALSVAAGELAVVLAGALIFSVLEKNNRKFIDIIKY